MVQRIVLYNSRLARFSTLPTLLPIYIYMCIRYRLGSEHGFFFLSLGHLNILTRSIHFLANFMVLFTDE